MIEWMMLQRAMLPSPNNVPPFGQVKAYLLARAIQTGAPNHSCSLAIRGPFCAEPVHVCPNECVAFIGDLADVDKCPSCHANRFNERGKPARVFAYIPVVPQLQRIFASPDRAEWVRWAGEHAATPGVVKDITESAGWKKFMVDSGIFADIRNLGLAFCADGINPFGRSAHSTWPLMLSVLNFPPHLRTRPDMLILLGLIPGPRTPKNINIYITCFSNELLAYGELGISTYDAFKREHFLLKFLVLQLIADYPAASKVLCMKGSGAIRGCHHCTVLGVKEGRQATTYGDYRRWLPMDHDWRRDTGMFGSEQREGPPRPRTNAEVRALAAAARAAHSKFGVKPGSRRDPGTGSAVSGWSALLDQDSFDPMEMYGVETMHILVRSSACSRPFACLIVIGFDQEGGMRHFFGLFKGERTSGPAPLRCVAFVILICFTGCLSF
jgi:hypothetical protein